MGKDNKSLGPAVIDGRLQYTSPSALQKFHTCKRMWRFRYVERLPDKPANAGSIRGTEGHGRIEKYLTTGVDILDPLEHLGIDHGHFKYPLPPNAHVEAPITLKANGVPIVGYMDLVEIARLARVSDWKFKKDLDAYAATKEELIDPHNDAGIQMLTYAKSVKDMSREVEHVQVRHVNFQTKGRREDREVKNTLSLSEIETKFAVVADAIPEMAKVAAMKDPFDVEKTESACFKYGGCAYREKCFNPLENLKRSIAKEMANGGSPMGVLSRLANVGTPTTPAASAPVADAPATPPAPVQAPATAPALSVGAPDQAPPPMPPPVQAPVASAVAMGVTSALQGSTTATTPPAPLTTPTEATAPAPQPKRRGRPPKAAQPAGGATAPVPQAPPAQAPTALENFKSDLVFLYFNCRPAKVEEGNFAAFVGALNDEVLASAKSTLVDLRMCSDPLLGFQKWKAYLGPLAVQKLADLPSGHYVVQLGDEREQCVADAIAMQPDVVPVYGLR